MSAAPASIGHRAAPYMSWWQGHRFKTEGLQFLFYPSLFRDGSGNDRGPWSCRFMARFSVRALRHSVGIAEDSRRNPEMDVPSFQRPKGWSADAGPVNAIFLV